MQIYFFEEFDTKEDIEKLDFIDFNCKIIFAAPNIKKFRKIEKKIKKRNKKIKEVIYWPILQMKEGYFISAFSENKGLKRIFNSILKEKNKISCMLDLEFPLQLSFLKFLYIIAKRFPQVIKNRKSIFDFLKKTEKKKITIYTAEYDVLNCFTERFLKMFCLTLDPKKIPHKRIVMLYTSFIKNQKIEDYLLGKLKKSKKKYENGFSVGLGTIAKGITKNEPILSPSELEHDIRVLNKNGIKEIIIYRLGGLNKEYIDIIKKYVN